MPTDLGQLLITVTSQGFDEVLDNLSQLEQAINRIGRLTGIDAISNQLQEMLYHLEGMHDGINELTELQTRAQNGAGNNANQNQEQFRRFGNTLGNVTKLMSAYWAVVAVPRKFINTAERVASFNMQLENMALNANTARSEITRLGVAAEGLGGSKQGMASTLNMFRRTAQGIRTGHGLGAYSEVMSLYGLDIGGSGKDGLATPTEMLKNIAALFERLGNDMESKLDIKDKLGMDEGTFRMLLGGVQEVEKELEKAAEDQKKMRSAEEAAMRVSKRKAEVEQEWAKAQLKMLEACEPLIDIFYDAHQAVSGLIQEFPKLSSAIGVLVASITAWKGAMMGWEAIKGIIGIGRAARVAEAASSVAGSAVGSVGSAVGGLVGGGPLGALATAVTGLVTTLQNAAMMTDIAKIEVRLAQWHQEWLAFTIKANDPTNSLLGKGEFQSYLAKAGVDPTIQNALYVAASNAREMNAYVSKVNRDEYKRREAEYERGYRRGDARNAGQSISIAAINITVSSDSSDAAEVARQVREELFRQINASIDDAQTGVNAL